MTHFLAPAPAVPENKGSWMKAVLCSALLSILATSCGKGQRVPRPDDLPAYVPNDAVIKRYSNQEEDGLLEISWGHTSMLWAKPCRAVESAIGFAQSEERVLECPVELDMKVRPLYLGTLSIPLTKSARQQGSATTCCYTFEVLGNR